MISVYKWWHQLIRFNFINFLSVHLKSICARRATFLLVPENLLASMSSSKNYWFTGSWWEGGEKAKKTLPRSSPDRTEIIQHPQLFPVSGGLIGVTEALSKAEKVQPFKGDLKCTFISTVMNVALRAGMLVGCTHPLLTEKSVLLTLVFSYLAFLFFSRIFLCV